jgi:hypothetical protein
VSILVKVQAGKKQPERTQAGLLLLLLGVNTLSKSLPTREREHEASVIACERDIEDGI